MQRASMTVVRTNGERYDANHLSIVRGQRVDERNRYTGAASDLVFTCSGGLIVIPANEVERIEYRDQSAGYCSECDGPLTMLAEGEVVPIQTISP